MNLFLVNYLLKKFALSKALGKRVSKKDEQLLYELIDSKTVLACYNVSEPSVSLNLIRDIGKYKLIWLILDYSLLCFLMIKE